MTRRRIGRLIRRPSNAPRLLSACPVMVRISMAFRSQSCNDQRPCTGVGWRGGLTNDGTLWVHGAAVNRLCHRRTYHLDHGLSPCGPQTVYARPIFRTCLTDPTASVVTQFGPMVEHS
jgi:hypothetical protein